MELNGPIIVTNDTETIVVILYEYGLARRQRPR